jgi:hypothetical protein
MSQLTLNSALGGTFTVAPPNVIGTVVATLPSTSGTLAYVNAAQTFTGLQTFDTLTTTGNVILGNASTDTLNVGNGGLVKDASGNVGIGTTNPGAKFVVQSPTQATTGDLIIDTTNGAAIVTIGRLSGTSSDSTTLNVRGRTGDSKLKVEPGGNVLLVTEGIGNVGIGTTAPGQKLEVAGNIYAYQGALYSDGATGSRGRLGLVGAGQTFTYDADTLEGYGASVYSDSVLGNLGLALSGYNFVNLFTSNLPRVTITSSGNVGIGTTTPGYKLTLSTDSAAKPSSSTWTVSSDERLKENIILADLDRCYEIVKSIPLKRYTWKDEVYTKEAVGDRSKLGWVAQDVKPLFNKAVNEHKQVLLTSTTTQEEYEEQDYTVDVVPKTTTEIKIINGIPTQVKTTVDEEVKTLLFNEVAVIDEEGNPVLNENEEPLLHQVPVMVTKYRDKVVYDEIEDCLDLQVDQLYAAMYGAIQALQLKVEKLEAQSNT